MATDVRDSPLSDGLYRAVKSIMESGISGKTFVEDSVIIRKVREKTSIEKKPGDVQRTMKLNLRKLSYKPEQQIPCPLCMSREHQAAKCPSTKPVVICGTCGGYGHCSSECELKLCTCCGSWEHTWRDCRVLVTQMQREKMLYGNWCLHCGGDHPSVLCCSLRSGQACRGVFDGGRKGVNPIVGTVASDNYKYQMANVDNNSNSNDSDTRCGRGRECNGLPRGSSMVRYTSLIEGWDKAMKETEVTSPEQTPKLRFSRPATFIIKQ